MDSICPTKFADMRTFGKRESEEIFTTTLDAQAAIHTLPTVLESLGMSFSVEAAN